MKRSLSLSLVFLLSFACEPEQFISEVPDVEIYDPTNDEWTELSNTLSHARVGHTAILQNDNVLIIGGLNSAHPTQVERINIATNQIESVYDLIPERFIHTSTMLDDGSILIAGGQQASQYVTATALIGENQASPGPALPEGRRAHSATLLEDGSVLIAGGYQRGALNTSYLYANGTFTQGPSLNEARQAHGATRLLNGRVLFSAGLSGGTDSYRIASSELYDPVAQTFTLVPDMLRVRHGHTSTLLDDGRVLICGGVSVDFEIENTCEIYKP